MIKNFLSFLDLFWSKIWPFLLKNQVFGCFLENRLSEFHVTRPETRDNCFQSFNGSVVSGKIVFWPFWPIFGQKYIACGDKLRFLTIFDQSLPVCWCLFDNFWSLGFSRWGLWMFLNSIWQNFYITSKSFYESSYFLFFINLVAAETP